MTIQDKPSDDKRLDLHAFEQAEMIIRTREDVDGNKYNDIGVMNQACWAGERVHLLLDEIKFLRGERWRLRWVLGVARRYVSTLNATIPSASGNTAVKPDLDMIDRELANE